MNPQSHIFISYARGDGANFAARLDDNLQSRGFKTWRDKRGIPPEKDFTAIIEKAIETSSHVVVCITRDSKRDDGFVRREIQYALMEGKPVLPARFEDITPHVHIVNNTFIDFFRDERSALEQLCSSLIEHKTIPVESPIDTTLFDPFRTYLETLYTQIVTFLDRAVINLVDISSEATPDAVQQFSVKSDMMLEFFAAQGFSDKPQNEKFENFKAAFAHYNGRLLLLGEPGAGKTITLMAYARDAVAQRLSDPTQPLPLLGLIPKWDYNTKPDFAEWIASGFHDLDAAPIRQVIHKQQALFLLDGLDELGLERIESIETEIRKTEYSHSVVEGEDVVIDPRYEFMNLIPHDNQVLVTSRVRDYYDIGDRIQLNGAVTLQPLTDSHLQAYLKDQPDLLSAVNSDEALRTMLRTPLILSLFAFAYIDKGEEAQRLRDLRASPFALRNEIIETYIKKRFEWENRKHPIKLTLDVLYNYLGIIAMRNAGSIEESNILTTQDFEILQNQIDHRTVIEIATRIHIFIPDGQDQFRFIHLMLRDHFGYAYAMRQLADESYYEDEAQPNPARALGRIGDDRAVPHLIAQLNHKSQILRLSAIEALGEIQASEAITPLIQHLNHDHWRVRDQATRALVQIGTAAVEPLISLFPIERDKQLAYHAATALKRIRDGIIQTIDHPLSDAVLTQIAEIVEQHAQVITLDDKQVSKAIAKLVWQDPQTGAEQTYLLVEGATVTIGRTAGSDIQIASQHVSRQHSVITYRDGIFLLSDLRSANGTFLNDVQIVEPMPLMSGDVIRLYIPTINFLAINSEEEKAFEKTKSSTFITPLQAMVLANIIITSGPQEGQLIPLDKNLMMVGRATSSAAWEIALQDPSVSRPHAQFTLENDVWYLTDLGSSNGTYVNGTTLYDRGKRPLKDGDMIAFGATTCLFRTR